MNGTSQNRADDVNVYLARLGSRKATYEAPPTRLNSTVLLYSTSVLYHSTLALYGITVLYHITIQMYGITVQHHCTELGHCTRH